MKCGNILYSLKTQTGLSLEKPKARNFFNEDIFFLISCCSIIITRFDWNEFDLKIIFIFLFFRHFIFA